MAEAAKVWAPPRWQYQGKHKTPTSIGWRQAVKDTGEPEAEACYHRSITKVERERIEMACLNDGHLFKERHHKRMYYMEMNRTIGASEGEETSLLYVEYLSGGEVHGRPITEQELIRKGAAL